MRKNTFILILLVVVFSCKSKTTHQTTNPQIIEYMTSMPAIEPLVTVSYLNENESTIQLKQVKTDITIAGPVAVTTWEFIFHNPNDRILEGEFNFPLPEGSVISRFALDIDGKLREGVTIEKAKGRQVFENVIRQQIDPALLEQTEGNNFRARIYPLPPKGERRILIAYESKLVTEKDQFYYCLPFGYKDTLDHFDLSVSVVRPGSKPQILETPFHPLTFQEEKGDYTCSRNQSSVLPEGNLLVAVPFNTEGLTVIEQGLKTDYMFFYTYLQPQAAPRLREKPTSIDIYWDCSLSMEATGREKEARLLDRYFKETGQVTVNLHLVNCVQTQTEQFFVQNGDWSDLQTRLRQVVYDGATWLGNIDVGKRQTDLVLLFTDGISTIGDGQPHTGTTPVYCVTSAIGADHSRLKSISASTGATAINLVQVSVEEAVRQLTHEPYRLISADYSPDEITSLTYLPDFISGNSGIGISGQLISDQAVLQLAFGYGNDIRERFSIRINKQDQRETQGIAERIWATTRVAVLDMNYNENKEEISRLARQYNLITRNTSMIVLDRVEDYVQYDITPPRELLKEYQAMKDRMWRAKTDRQKSHTDYVVGLFNERKKWWRNGEQYTTTVHPFTWVEDIVWMDSYPALSGQDAFDEMESPLPLSPPELIEELNVVEDDIAEDHVFYFMEDAAMPERSSASPSKPAEKKQPSYVHLYPASGFRASIRLEKRETNENYMRPFHKATKENYYNVYLEQRKEYGENPMFYTDIASFFRQKGLKEEAFLILSNLAEMELESHKLLRGVGHYFLQWGYTDFAVFIFEKVKELRPDEAQSFRDLAHAYAQKQQYQEAVDHLHTITTQPWDERFPEIEVIAVTEMNEIIARARREGKAVETGHIDARLIEHLPVDIRVVIGWNTDNSDIDLWVTDPLGEMCNYSNRSTRIRGAMSRDFTQGFGPEEFMVKQAIKGDYKIQADYYGTREQILKEPILIYMDIYTRYGQKGEQKQSLIFRLSHEKEVLTLGTVTISD